MTLPDKNLDWPIAYEAVLEIARSEGCKLKAYLRNVFPRNTSRNFANGFWADIKQRGKRAGGNPLAQKPTNDDDLLLAEDGDGVVFPNKTGVRAVFPGPPNVFFVRHPLKVARSVIRFVPVYVVDMKPFFVSFAERFADKAVDRKPVPTPVDHDGDFFVAAFARALWGKYFLWLEAFKRLSLTQARPSFRDRPCGALHPTLIADNKFELAVFNLFPTFHDLTPTVVVNRPYHAGHRYAIC